MSDSKKKIIRYFGYGSNSDLDMMVHMVGRKDLKGEPGRLLGYELCVQKLEHIRDIVPPDSPYPVPPRQIVGETFGESFELYIARPKKDGITYGTIWELTEEEIELVKEWELVDYGMQEEINATAIDSKGKIIAVETQAVMDPPPQTDRVITGNDYPRYIAPKDKMLEVADKTRLEYLEKR